MATHAEISVWHRITREVKYNPGLRISEIMLRTRVSYAEFKVCLSRRYIQSDAMPIPTFTVTKKGKWLVS